MKTAYFVGVLAAISDISVATPNLHNGIPGSIDGLFTIENDHLKKNMAQREDGKAVLIAPSRTDDSQLWYFELSEDKIHVAIKSYKYKRHAIDDPAWLLYKLEETKFGGTLVPPYVGTNTKDVQFQLRSKTKDVAGEWQYLTEYGSEYLSAAPWSYHPDTYWNIRLYKHETPQLSNGIPGSVDGLFFIQNELHQRNMMQGDDARVTLAAQGTTFNENQLWYFELSEDRKHVAIKSYKYKEHAFNDPEWFLYELLPTKKLGIEEHTASHEQFRIMSKSNRNILVSQGDPDYVYGTPLNDYSDTVWNIIFYRYSIQDKPMNGEFYIRNAQPSHNLPNLPTGAIMVPELPDRRQYNKHLSTMAKLTCAGEDLAAAIFETSSSFNTAQLFTFEYHPKGKYVRIVSSVQNKYWTKKLVFQGRYVDWYFYHGNFGSPDSAQNPMTQWFELVETGTSEKYKIKTMTSWKDHAVQTFLQGVHNQDTNMNYGSLMGASYIRGADDYTPRARSEYFRNDPNVPGGCLMEGMEGSCDWYIRPRYRAQIKRVVDAKNQYRNCQKAQKYERKREITMGWTSFSGIANSHTTSQGRSFQSSLENSINAQMSAGGSFMGIGMEASLGASETSTKTTTNNMATEMSSSASSSTTKSLVHKETTWFRPSPMTYLEYYQYRATVRSTDNAEFTGVRTYYGVKGSYEVPLSQSDCDKGTGAGSGLWHNTRGTFKG